MDGKQVRALFPLPCIVKVLICPRYFSTAVSSSKNRKTFANKILNVYNQFDLDGIDIDWEYPGQSGYHGNHVSRNDTANLLLFLRQLRTTLPASAKISATGQTVPFANANGDPIADASPFAAVLDWVLIMNYDTWGGASTFVHRSDALRHGCLNLFSILSLSHFWQPQSPQDQMHLLATPAETLPCQIVALTQVWLRGLRRDSQLLSWS